MHKVIKEAIEWLSTSHFNRTQFCHSNNISAEQGGTILARVQISTIALLVLYTPLSGPRTVKLVRRLSLPYVHNKINRCRMTMLTPLLGILCAVLLKFSALLSHQRDLFRKSSQFLSKESEKTETLKRAGTAHF